MSLGSTLRAAREACGITTSELAARTHMLVQIVEGLENEDFRRIPAPIYGRGFIKLYCEAVNIDPKPLQAEFMELFNRPKDAPSKADPPPVPRPRPVPPPVQPAPAQAPAAEPESSVFPAADGAVPPPSAVKPPAASAEPAPQPMAELGELFAQPAQPAYPAEPPAAVTASVPPKRSYGDLFGQTYAAEEEPARLSAAEKFRNTMSNVSSGVFANVQNLPPNTGRLVAVSLCALAVFTLIGWGVFALYRATTPATDGAAAQAGSAETASAEKQDAKPGKAQAGAVAEKKTAPKTASAEKGRTDRKAPSAKPGELKTSGIDIPALYID